MGVGEMAYYSSKKVNPSSCQDEKFDLDKGPSVEQLVIQESVDKLDYMGWQIDQGADPEKVDNH